MKTLGEMLHRVSAWLLLAALAVAPWLLGTEPPWAIYSVLCMLGAAAACWAAGLFLRGGERRPPINAATVLAGLLLVQGFWMTANPVSKYDPATRTFEKIRAGGLLPGSVDGHSSRLAMLSFGVLFLVFHVALDHAQGVGAGGNVNGKFGPAGETFRRALAWVAAGTGASVAVLGILQRAGATDFLLSYMNPQEREPFGPFNYHVSAGVFLLLALPLAAVLAVRAWVSGKIRTGWIAGALAALILAGIFVDTARSAVVMAVVLAAVLGIAIWRTLSRVMPDGPHASRKWWWFTAAGVTAALVAGAALTAALMPAKWALLRRQLGWDSPRMILWRIDANMAWDAGVWGTGPGTFAVEFPGSPRLDRKLYKLWIVTYHTPGNRVSIWSHAHQDVLQAFIEWGYVGGLLWLALGATTVAAGWRACRRSTGGPASARLLALGALAAVLVVLAGGLFDFPLQVLVLQAYATCLAAVLWAEGGMSWKRLWGKDAGGIGQPIQHATF